MYIYTTTAIISLLFKWKVFRTMTDSTKFPCRFLKINLNFSILEIFINSMIIWTISERRNLSTSH